MTARPPSVLVPFPTRNENNNVVIRDDVRAIITQSIIQDSENDVNFWKAVLKFPIENTSIKDAHIWKRNRTVSSQLL